MEDLDQSYGYILYRTQLAAGPGGELAIDGLHDYAQIYVDQQTRRHRSTGGSVRRTSLCLPSPRRPRSTFSWRTPVA